jgi:hypothetical protein
MQERAAEQAILQAHIHRLHVSQGLIGIELLNLGANGANGAQRILAGSNHQVCVEVLHEGYVLGVEHKGAGPVLSGQGILLGIGHHADNL